MTSQIIKQTFRQILQMPTSNQKSLTQARHLRRLLKTLAELEHEAGFIDAQETAGDWLDGDGLRNEGYE